MLVDVGEFIPYAKKEIHNYNDSPSLSEKSVNNCKITLKSIWPEPDWIAMYTDGADKLLLSLIYSIYHALKTTPHDTERYRFNGIKITLEMWEQAYIETVSFIRNGCENATMISDISELEESFKKHFNIDGKPSYKTYAAGVKTPKTFFHPFGKNGSARAYQKLLPLLDWPLGVNAKKIPYFPIELQDRKTKQITYSLGKFNKKSVLLNGDNDDYKNEFETYEKAVNALVTFHQEEFKIDDDLRQIGPVYIPKKNTSMMQGVNDTYPNKTPEELMTEFAFRGIQFGNYLPQKERQTYINNSFYALHLLSKILGIPQSWVGGRKLGLSFGARGHGYASAHYELDLHVINLTRFNGPGSIAHEVFHAFDARMANRWLGHVGLLSNMIVDKEVVEDLIEEKHRWRFQAYENIVLACTMESDYVQNAWRIESQKGGAKYWKKASELCARAFESYIQDELEKVGIVQQWLACGTKELDYQNNGMHPYPVGQDRKRIAGVLLQNLPLLFGNS